LSTTWTARIFEMRCLATLPEPLDNNNALNTCGTKYPQNFLVEDNRSLQRSPQNKMNLLLLAPITLAIQSSGNPVDLKSRVTEASVFKSGLVMLTREVTIPAGDGLYSLDVIPQAIDGSFWYSSPDGLLVTDVETTIRINDEKLKATAQTVGDYLAANVGRRVKLTYRTTVYSPGPVEKEVPIEGILNGPPRGQTNIVPFKMDDGELENLSITNIVQINTNGLNSELSRSIKTPELKIRFRAHAEKSSRLDFLTMESGAAWIGNYLVKLQAGGVSQVVGKAQLGLGRLTFDETNVKALAGEPHLNENSRYDLAAGIGGLNAFLDRNQESYLSFQPGDRDPYLMLQQMANDAANARAAIEQGTNFQLNDAYMNAGNIYAAAGGGFGGGRGGYAPSPASADTALRQVLTRELASQGSTDRLESLYSYSLGKVSLKPGDRLSRILFSQASAYESIFRWEAEVGTDNSVVKSLLRIHNTGTSPWTGGQVFITKEETPLAQVEMPFTPAGKFADLEMANTQDILTKKEETEVSREIVPMPGRPKASIPRTTNEVHLTVESARNETAKFELTLLVPGELIEANGGKIEKLTRKLDTWNGQSRIIWSFNLNAGDKREFKIQYRRLG